MARNLTAKFIDAVKPGSARREIPDGLLPGLYLVVQPSGAKSWAVRYRHAGRPRKLTLGTLAALPLADARDAARTKLQEVAEGQDPALAKKAARDPDTVSRNSFESVTRLFIRRYAKPKNRSWAESARLLGLCEDKSGNLIVIGDGDDKKRAPGPVKKWGPRPIQSIARRDVIELLDEIVDRGAPIVANRTLAALRKLFAWALERGIVEANPAAGMRPPAAAKSRDRVLSDDELTAVWRAADALGWPFGPAILLLALTGARREEIRALRWTEVDTDAAVIRLRADRTKTGEARVIPLSAPALAIIEALPHVNGSDLVFTTTGSTPIGGWSKAKATIDDASGVTDWKVHDLRRTVATGLQRLAQRLEVIEAVLGHTSGSRAGIVGVYQRHAFEPEKRSALDAWARHVGALVDGAPSNVRELRSNVGKVSG